MQELEYSLNIVLLLIISGIVVGVINTFAGAGASISMMLYSLLGCDLMTANATNRISVLMQTVTMSVEFKRQGKLNIKTGLLLSIPTIIGSVVGSYMIESINHTLFAILLCIVLLIMLLLLFFNPTKALKQASSRLPARWYHYVVLLLIGFYGGAFHIGIGYLFLFIFIAGLGYDLMEANALKGFVVLPYTIFSLVVFIFYGNILWCYGLIHGAGNVIGAYLAAHYSRYIPIAILRVGVILFLIFTIIYITVTKIL